MKILITGGLGFIFSHVAEQLFSDGHEIDIVDAYEDGSNPDLVPYFEELGIRIIKDRCESMSEYDLDYDIIIHAAAESNVDKSISDVKKFYKSNILGTINMLDIARDQDNLKKFVMVNCYDSKTRAFTNNGLKSYNEITTDDKVLSLNMNGEVEWKEVEEVIISDYKGDMIHIDGKRTDMVVTPNHRMLIRNTSGKIKFEEAATTMKRSYCQIPKGKWIGPEQEDEGVSYIEGIGAVWSKDLFYFIGIYCGDGFCAYQERKVATKSGLNKEEFWNRRDRNGRFIPGKQKGSNHISTCKCHRIFIDIPESDECRKRVEETLTRMEIEWTAHKGRAGEHIYFSSKEWSDFLKQFGKGEKNKAIPRWVLDSNHELLSQLFDGLMDSDGHHEGTKPVSYGTVSEKLMENIVEIASKLGMNSNAKYSFSSSVLDGRTISGHAWRINFSKTEKGLYKKNYKRINYDGKIWCLKVKDNKNFLTERSGFFDYSGNTDEIMGSTDDLIYKYDLIRPANPYASSKAAGGHFVGAYENTYGLPVTEVRMCNVIGRRQDNTKFIPSVIENLSKNLPVTIYGDGLATREYIDVRDVAKIFSHLLLNIDNCDRINAISHNQELSILEVIMKISKIMKVPVVLKDGERKGHDLHYRMQGSSIMRTIEKSKFNFDETIQWIISNS